MKYKDMNEVQKAKLKYWIIGMFMGIMIMNIVILLN